jgi:hypothetical protein
MSDLDPHAATKITSEEAENYHAVVTRLSDDWRVIVCRAGIQWRARWTGRSYCRSAEALTRLSRKHAGTLRPDAAAFLAELPERIEERAPNADATAVAP